ncbi:MAG: bifunctional metallophosphatase/5'-nucleotidase [Candidatus Aminicenantes bacterium]|nr:bifunctional metallophosphatase/5'-nucleotidase [Candidatus Aminicenantes bacterium]
MKKITTGLILSLVILALFDLPLMSTTLTIVHSNDTHGRYRPYTIKQDGEDRLIGGMEAVSHYLNAIRKSDKNVLVIDKGDILTGTIAATITYKDVIGGVMVEFLNRLGYDLWNLGNHEFDKGIDNALGMAALAEFPTIQANIITSKDKKLLVNKPYFIFERDNLKVGVIAVMEENFLVEVSKDRVEGLDVLPMVPTLNFYMEDLERETDLVIVIVHSGFKDGLRIAQEVPGIDVILCASEEGRFQVENGVLVQSTIGHQQTLGYLKLDVEKGKIVNYEQKLIWLWADIELNPSPRISSLVKDIEKAVGEECKKVIGEAKTDYMKLDYPTESLNVENELGNWITDVMRWKTNAQIGLHNSGAIRSNIRAGSICIQDVFEVSPFNNTLVLFEISGKQLKDILELDVERVRDRLQVSGLAYKYYSHGKKVFGERVDFIEVNGEIIVKDGKLLLPEKKYTVVSNDYVVGHAKDKYFGFSVPDSKDTLFLLDQTLVDWLQEYKILNYKNESRIVRIIESPLEEN